MTSLTPPYHSVDERQQLSSLRDELMFFQEESRFFHRILRKALLSGTEPHEKIDGLINQLLTFRKETLPNLQRALRSLDGQSANSTTADHGLSQVAMFSEGIEEARQRLNTIKRQAFHELNTDFIPTPIW